MMSAGRTICWQYILTALVAAVTFCFASAVWRRAKHRRPHSRHGDGHQRRSGSRRQGHASLMRRRTQREMRNGRQRRIHFPRSSSGNLRNRIAQHGLQEILPQRDCAELEPGCQPGYNAAGWTAVGNHRSDRRAAPRGHHIHATRRGGQ